MSEITGPSSQPQKPIIHMGPVAAPVARTAGQGGATWIVMELLESYNLVEFTDRQWAVTLLAGATLVSFIQNKVEAWRGRRLVGADE